MEISRKLQYLRGSFLDGNGIIYFDIFRFKWERNNIFFLVTVRMGLMVILIYPGNLRITNYRGKYRGILPW